MNNPKKNDLSQSINKFLDVMPALCAVLDWNRKIVYANQELLNFIGFEALEELISLRPGDVLNCIHSKESPGGCGTSLSCRYCGMFNALRQSLENQETVHSTCCIIRKNDDKIESLELKITASPVTIEDSIYIIVIINDISNEIRRATLEKFFFHDLLNRVGALKGYAELITMLDEPVQSKSLATEMNELCNDLADEILSHRDLVMAENKSYQINTFPIQSLDVLQMVKKQMQKHDSANNKTITIDPNAINTSLITDVVLLKRSLINLLKNALEASSNGETITLNCQFSEENMIQFSVHNPFVIPIEIQNQLFNKTFSSKDRTRGLGTFSVKLFVENYLKGKVSFVSDKTIGTLFKIDLPKEISE